MTSAGPCQVKFEKRFVKRGLLVYNEPMKTIDEDIKTGQYKKVYLLYGEEKYLIRQYRDKLVKALSTEGDTMNFSSFSGDDLNQCSVIDLA